MAEFRVKFPHMGDRMYLEGETREADPLDVRHLVESGLLKPTETDAAAADKGRAKK